MNRWITIGAVVTIFLLPVIGFVAASKFEAARAAAQAEWIRTHIIPGVSRADAYAMLKSQWLVASNDAYIKGKGIPAISPNPKDPLSGTACDTEDKSSGEWPYQDEALPRQDAECALDPSIKPTRNPDADILLGGGFTPFCGWETRIKLTFGDDDRVKRVYIGQPQATCM